jgi:hypothetical protein
MYLFSILIIYGSKEGMISPILKGKVYKVEELERERKNLSS